MKELSSKLIKLPNGGHEQHTYLSGTHEGVGREVQGWSGTETLVSRSVIKPLVIFEVINRTKTKPA